MKIKITLDTACDLSQELIEKYDFATIPFMVTLGMDTYEDGKIDTSQIFDYVTETGNLPKTSAINEESFYEFFSEIKKDCDAIIHFSISSHMSAACNNAINAAKRVDNVYVIDSHSLSTGIALLAIYAKELCDTSMDVQEIVKKINEKIDKVQASFVIERLDYLHKGGRCSSLAFFGANLLKLRPQIVVSDGKMKSTHKFRGKMPKVVTDYCYTALEENQNADKKICFITHSHATQEMVDAAYNVVKAAGFETIYQTYAGCTVSSHCGKNTLGILFMNK